MIEHAPILIVAVPLLGVFFTPLVGMISSRARDVFVTIISALTVLMVCLTGYALISNDYRPIVYTLGAKAPIPEIYTIPVRILLEIDGLNFLIALIVSVLVLLAIIYSRSYMSKDTGLDKYYTLVLLLLVGLLGMAITGDIFNIFVFLEISAISSYALTAFRKDRSEAVEAAFKYMVVGSIASLFVLLGATLFYGEYGTLTMALLADRMQGGATSVATVALAFFIVGFVLKGGAVPLHMWVADAYSAAPSSISMLFAGISSKVGVYALLRVVFTIYGLSINEVTIGWLVIAFALVTMFVGTSMALVQYDFKRLLAYSSISQIGYVFLGVGIGLAVIKSDFSLAVASINGGVFHLINHAMFTALLFAIAGIVWRQVGTRNMIGMGGLARNMPFTTICFIIGAASCVGLPPLNGFASKWMIFEASAAYNPILTIVAIAASLMTFGVYAKVFHAVFLGRRPEGLEKVEEAPRSMLLPPIILAILCVIMGILPSLMINTLIQPATGAMVNQLSYIQAVLGS